MTRLVQPEPTSHPGGGAEMGRKAATLERLRAAGFPVPDSVVIAPHVDAGAAAARLSQVFGDRPVAIRSSAPDEDGPDFSGAGRYATVLNVVGTRWVAQAIETVRGTNTSEPIPVLVMPMLEVEVAGVVFTRNPVTGDAEVVVEAVRGPATQFLAGIGTPEQWTVADGSPTLVSGAGDVLTPEVVKAVAELAQAVERAEGTPQDVEWAVADGRLWLLQARPITALPRQPVLDVPEGETWVRVDENFAMPLRPLEFEVWAHRAERATKAAVGEVGLPFDRIAFRLIGGWVYSRLVPLGSDDGPRLPRFIIRALFHAVPELRKRMRAATAVWESPLAESVAHQWDAEAGPRLDSEARRLWEVDRTALGDSALVDHLRQGLTLLEEAWWWHSRLTLLATMLGAGRLGSLLNQQLGWEPHQILTLLHHGDGPSARLGQAVERLAASIRSDKAAREALYGATGDLSEPLRRHLQPILAEHGHVVMGSDFTQPTWAEDPRSLLALVESMLNRDPASELSVGCRALRAEMEARDALDDSALDEFDRALDSARRLQPYADVTEWTALAATGAVRLALAEIGRRLAGADRLGEPWDILYFTEAELFDLLEGRPPNVDLSGRKAEYRWALSHRGPLRYGPELDLAHDPKVLPRRLRAPVTAMLWAATLTQRNPVESPGTSGGYRGTPASPGVATGPARIVRNPADFSRVRPGDVLVCPYTLAAWAAVFPLASAVIAESGGPLSHPAVLAREFGIPAVVGLDGATALFPEGALLEVDGSTGWVRRI
ncbi:MAG: PEP/pyruvate-binding domain-containing protein [Acidimicrobiia bacterium]